MPIEHRYNVPAVDRATEVLEILATSREGLSLSELTTRTGVPKSSLFRILLTLEEREYVMRDYESRRFSLGLKLWELSNAKLEKIDLVSVASKHMKWLAHETRESVFLAILDRGEVIYLQRMESPATVKAVTKLGWRAPVHCTATGQVLLAFLPQNDIDAILNTEPLHSYNKNTITNLSQLRKKLERIRATGYAAANGEYNADLLCISAPIRDATRNVVAALTVAMLAHITEKDKKVARVAQLLKKACDSISRELGCSADTWGNG